MWMNENQWIERFSNECRKTKTKAVTPTNQWANSAMNQSQFLAITCNSLEAREESRVQGAIGLGFASHWLKNWRESFKPITKRTNHNHVITFDSHLKTALIRWRKVNGRSSYPYALTLWNSWHVCTHHKVSPLHKVQAQPKLKSIK